MTKNRSHDHRHHDHDDEEKDDKGEFLSGAAEQAKEIASNYFDKDDEKVIHCTKCHNAEKSEKLIKSTLLVSVCALILSIASIALPYFNTVQFSPEEWELFLNKLGENVETEEPIVLPPAELPEATKPKPVKPVVVRSSAAASVVSSVSVATSSSNVAVGGGVSSQAQSSAVSSEAPAPSSSTSEASVASEKSVEAAPADGTSAQKAGSL